MARSFSTHFPLSEFEKVSHRTLLEFEKDNASRFSLLLHGVRARFGPIVLTSFVRSNDPRAHGKGLALDFVPLNRSELLRKQLFEYLVYTPDVRAQFGRILNETDHIHITLPEDRPIGYDTAYAGWEVGKKANGQPKFFEIPARRKVVGLSILVLVFGAYFFARYL